MPKLDSFQSCRFIFFFFFFGLWLHKERKKRVKPTIHFASWIKIQHKVNHQFSKAFSFILILVPFNQKSFEPSIYDNEDQRRSETIKRKPLCEIRTHGYITTKKPGYIHQLLYQLSYEGVLACPTPNKMF